MNQPTQFRLQYGWLAALFGLLGLFLVLQTPALATFERDYDEGVYLAEAHLVYTGHELYSEVKSASPPLFIWGLAGTFALADGPSVHAARLMILLLSAVGLAATAFCARLLAPAGWGDWAGLAASLLLLLFPRWFLYGQMAMADIPSLSFSLVAVALALQGWRGGRRYFFLSGIAAGIAVGIKFLAAYTAPLLALIVLLGHGAARPLRLSAFTLDGFATLAGFLLPFLMTLPFLDLAATYEVIFRFPWEAGREFIDRTNALRLMAIFHWEHAGWLLLALVGLVALARQGHWRIVVLLLGWESLVVIMLVQHAPLWGHLLLPLAPPVILAGALALGSISASAKESRPLILLPTAAFLLLLLLLPRAWQADQGTIVAPTEQILLRDTIVPWLQATVPPNEPIMSDDPMLAVRAERLLPPDMTDTSFTKLQSGFLSSDDLIDAAQRTRPAAIIFWSDRFRSKPSWREWVEANYTVGRQESPTRVIFLRPDLAP